MKVARKVELRPSTGQRRALGRAAGCARWAWNWGLGRQLAAMEAGEKRPTAIDLHRDLNILQKLPEAEGGVPWMYEVSKCAPQEALRDLDQAWTNRREGRAQRPRFKAKDRSTGAFRVTGSIRVADVVVAIPRVGKVRIMPGDRGHAEDGAYAQVAVTEDATGRWYASVLVDVPEASLREGPVVGCDLGVRKLATLSDGTFVANPKALKRSAKKLRRCQKALSRSKRGSGRRRRKKRAAARAHRRVACVRRDAQHKATTAIVKSCGTVVVESLNVRGMTARRRGKGRASKAGLNRAILDAGFGEMLRMLVYKGNLHGCRIIEAPPFYPSSRLCSECGATNDPGSSETYTCASCGTVMDRDLNAARNLAKVAASSPETENARGAAVRPRAPRRRAAALKRESRPCEPTCHG